MRAERVVGHERFRDEIGPGRLRALIHMAAVVAVGPAVEPAVFHRSNVVGHEIVAELVAKALVPDYALGSHTASLGLVFYRGDLLPQRYRGGAFVGQHGSWNRQPLAGYRVIFVPFANGRPTGAKPEEILTGFVDKDENALGRPVGVAVDARGALLVADDVGNRIWRVTSTQEAISSRQ